MWDVVDRWNRIWSERASGYDAEPALFLQRIAAHLPRAGTALDVAGGAGRNAVWLAGRGLAVTCADLSPVGLEMAETLAAANQVSITTLMADCEQTLPGAGWDLIVCVHFLSRRVLETVGAFLAPGGLFAFVQPTVENLKKHSRPGRRWLLEVGEALELLDPRLEVITCDEGWSEEGRHEVELLARLPVS